MRELRLAMKNKNKLEHALIKAARAKSYARALAEWAETSEMIAEERNSEVWETEVAKAKEEARYAWAAEAEARAEARAAEMEVYNKKVLYFDGKGRAKVRVEEAYKNAQLAWAAWGAAWATRESSEAEAWSAVVEAEAELVKAKLEADCE